LTTLDTTLSSIRKVRLVLCLQRANERRSAQLIFSPGLPYTNHHNARSAHLTFHIPRAGVCHGFAGYFEAVLYGDVGLSIHPERAAGDMLSWFPIFFPLMVRPLLPFAATHYLSLSRQNPVYLPARSELDVQIWRMTDGPKRKVWFEWTTSAYLSASALSFSPSPPTSATSATFPPNRHPASADTLSPRLNGPWDARSQRGSPMVDAFQSAPSPLLAGGGAHDRRDSGRMQGIEEEESGEARDEGRIMISQSKLHNPGGRTSFIGL
jgi:protein arginine N-methyltransferase 5